MMKSKYAELLAVAFFVSLIAVVFYQIQTSMVEQGIASGTPYDNAAAYPRTVAIIMAILVCASIATNWFLDAQTEKEELPRENILRFVVFMIIIALYLLALGFLGYHISTPLMIMAVMLLCGYVRFVEITLASLTISLTLSFVFEVFLTIVLPGGIWKLNIPWMKFFNLILTILPGGNL